MPTHFLAKFTTEIACLTRSENALRQIPKLAEGLRKRQLGSEFRNSHATESSQLVGAAVRRQNDSDVIMPEWSPVSCQDSRYVEHGSVCAKMP